MTRWSARLALAALAPLSVLAAAEFAARARPDSAPTDSELALLWVAGTRPAFDCDPSGNCRTNPELVRLSNPDERFRAAPAPGTFRVVCVGDSTTAGWPYQPRGGYPERLAQVLRAALAPRRVEVLNLGVHAWDGARLETVFGQALAFHPDAVLVRVGYDDYPHFLLRHPRGGAVGRIAQSARLFLLSRSAAFRLLSRGLGPAPRQGIVASPLIRLTADEEDLLVADHRRRLERLARRAASARAPLIVLGLPYWAGFAPRYPGLSALSRQKKETAGAAKALGLPFVALDDLPESEFLDLMHADDRGEARVARDAARALEAAGLPVGARWRWSRVPTDAAIARALRLDEADYRAHLEARLAAFFASHGLMARAQAHMEAALRAAPNPDLVPLELRSGGDAATREVYRAALERLRRSGRDFSPRQAEDRAFAGL